ncbi:hypothetical protein P43SY_009168 [Pythium insidiosum]|uniref:Uncharacterized protein n=1 Tax=Pythium insidiosum TaxID=114742 RepID=A0AAD5M7Z5_PYTIN|nr:hypothetical protein P43SY_009168 [Pythium insidiosum]
MYQASRLLSSVWINALFLAITVVNCWSTPLLQHALAHYSALERVICLALDAVLDAGTCLFIPLVIVFKYIRAFDREQLEFPPEKLNDPEWFVSMILENRMLFAMDKVDLFSKLVPHHSLYGCINKVKELMYRMPPEMDPRNVAYASETVHQGDTTVPTQIQSLSSLLKFMIYNSTIVSWTAEASINDASHPDIISICVVLTNMTAVPEGLLVGLPTGLQDIQFARTNLTTLPDELPQRWRKVTRLLFELSTLPDSFSGRSGPLGSLTLSDNAALTSLPASDDDNHILKRQYHNEQHCRHKRASR